MPDDHHDIHGGPDASGVRVISPNEWGPPLPVVEGTGACHEITGPLHGQHLRSLYHVELGQLSSTVRLRHESEAVYYVIEGVVSVGSSAASTVTAAPGGMLHIASETDYALSTVAGATLVGGPAPVDPAFGTPIDNPAEAPQATSRPATPPIREFHRDQPSVMAPIISKDARLVVWYGVGALTANMNYVILEPGEANQEHAHDRSEDTIFVLEGRGTAHDITHDRRLPFGPRDTITVPPGVVHAIAADHGERLVSVGGPCPADVGLLRALGIDLEPDPEATT